MHRRLQFGMRENPASDRRHGSRQATRSPLGRNGTAEEDASASPPAAGADHLPVNASGNSNAAPIGWATVTKCYEGSLLTVHEVAKVLRVPVSWVYARTRTRSVERLPGIRLGKYWRFRGDDILAWIEARYGGRRAS